MHVTLSSEGRDQEDCNSIPAWGNNLQDPILKNISQKKWTGGVAQGQGPELMPQYCKKKKWHSHNYKSALSVEALWKKINESSHRTHVGSHYWPGTTWATTFLIRPAAQLN
jgi:hypothetical protein